MADALTTLPACLCGAHAWSGAHHYSEPPIGETRFHHDVATYDRDLYRCDECGHFRSVGGIEPADLYREAYVEATYGAATLSDRFDRILALPPGESDNHHRVGRVTAFAHRHLGGSMTRRTLLDIGAGLGVFPFAMQQRGWRCRALDPDPLACEHLRQRGIETSCGTLDDDVVAGRYDLVSLNKVLEHVEDPRSMLIGARELVDAAGWVYVEVPDGPGAFVEGPHREEFFIEHLHVFSERSLRALACESGFNVAHAENIREPSSKYTFFAMLIPRS